MTPRDRVTTVPSPLELRQQRSVSSDAWLGLLYAGVIVAIAAVTFYCWWTA